MPHSPPQFIGKYEIEKMLPRGGMALVYRARHPDLPLNVAVKILNADAADDEERREEFLREAKIASGLQHENVVRVYDFGQEGDRPFIVMDFVEGEDLGECIRSATFTSIPQKLEVARQMAAALKYIHQQGIVHRDVKPGNFMHSEADGKVKLLDFGIAKQSEVFLTSTAPGASKGTPYYMAPEQTPPPGKITHLVDVYAFGVLLFELFAERKWTDRDLDDLAPETRPWEIFRRIKEEPLDLQSLRELGVPESICALIRRCTEKEPEDRIQNFGEIGELIDRIVREMRGQTPSGEETIYVPRRSEETVYVPRPQPGGWVKVLRDKAVGRPVFLLPVFLILGFLLVVLFVTLRPETGEDQASLDPEPGAVVEPPDVESPSGGGGLADLFAPPDVAVAPPIVITPGVDVPVPPDIAVEPVIAAPPEPAATEPVPPAPPLGGPPETAEVAPPPIIETLTGQMILIPAVGDVADFYIDRTEVTNGAFRSFCEQTGYACPADIRVADPDAPVVNVTIADARAFAGWAGKRLPTLEEWRAAVQSVVGGNVPDPGTANVSNNPRVAASAPMPVGSFEERSPLRDMLGNVWEMVDEPLPPTEATLANYSSEDFRTTLGTPFPPTREEPWFAMMGGSYEQDLVPDPQDWALFPARLRWPSIGFRCVQEVGP